MSYVPLLVGFYVDVLLNVVGWAISSNQETDKLFDLFGSLSHIFTIFVALISGGSWAIREMIGTSMIYLWAIRLGVFLFTRVIYAGGDKRLEKIKSDAGRFAIFWFLQTLWVMFNILPLMINISYSKGDPSEVPLGILDAVAIGSWIFGFLFEVIADEQKRLFRAVKDNKGAFITTGLWSLSRHPNYFGEILMWISFAVFSAPPILARGGFGILSLLSPSFTVLLLLFVSGVPPLARAGLAKWGWDERYHVYLATTSVVIPFPSTEATLAVRNAAKDAATAWKAANAAAVEKGTK